MLHEFLTANRLELIDRCQASVAQRVSPEPSDAQIENGIPLFLDQLIRTLRAEENKDAGASLRISGSAAGNPDFSEIGASAVRHGSALLKNGYTIDQVVHDYGDMCQAITNAAIDAGEPIGVDEFRTLNRCLDNAIADAVGEFSHLSNASTVATGERLMNEKLGALSHELRNHLHTAALALAAIKTGQIELGGATGGALERSLLGMRTLIDRSLADVRLTAGIPPRRDLFSLAHLIADIQVSATLEANSRSCSLVVSTVDPTLAVDGDRDLLLSAVGNLLQNAFKFTDHATEVSLDAYGSLDRILIDVSDRCGGLAPGVEDSMFLPFTQQSRRDKSGLGLGLSICRRSVEEHSGELSVRDVPGIGCVFTINLPRHAVPPAPAVTA